MLEKEKLKKDLENEKTYLELSIKNTKKKHDLVKNQAKKLGFSEEDIGKLIESLRSSTNNRESEESEDDITETV